MLEIGLNRYLDISFESGNGCPLKAGMTELAGMTDPEGMTGTMGITSSTGITGAIGFVIEKFSDFLFFA